MKMQRYAKTFALIAFLAILWSCASTTHTSYPIGADAIDPVDSDASKNAFANKNSDELIAAGFVYLAAGNTSLARLHFAAAAQKAPENPVPYLGMGDADFKEDNFPAALRNYQKAGSLDGDNLAAIIGQGKALRQQGNLDSAIEVLTRGKAMAPDNHEILTELAISFNLQGKDQVATELFREVALKTPPQAAALNNLGVNLISNKQYAEAAVSLRQASMLRPDDQQIRNNLAMALALSGEEAPALAIYKKTVGEAEAWNNIGFLYMTQKRFDEAERALHKAQEVNPKYYEKAQENLERLKNMRKVATGQSAP